MRLRSGLAIVVLVGMLAALAGGAAAGPRRWIVSGTLDAVDELIRQRKSLERLR